MKSRILMLLCLAAASCNDGPQGNPLPNVALQGVVFAFPGVTAQPSASPFEIDLDGAAALKATTQGAPCPGPSCAFTVEEVPYSQASNGVSVQVRPQDANWVATSSDVSLTAQSAEPNALKPHTTLSLQPAYVLPASLVRQLTQTLGDKLSSPASLIVGVLKGGPTEQSVEGFTVTDSSSFKVFYLTAEGTGLQPASSASGLFVVVTPGTDDIWGTAHAVSTTVNNSILQGVVTLDKNATAAVVIQLPEKLPGTA